MDHRHGHTATALLRSSPQAIGRNPRRLETPANQWRKPIRGPSAAQPPGVGSTKVAGRAAKARPVSAGATGADHDGATQENWLSAVRQNDWVKTFEGLFEELRAKVAAGDPQSGTVAAVALGVHGAGKKVVE